MSLRFLVAYEPPCLRSEIFKAPSLALYLYALFRLLMYLATLILWTDSKFQQFLPSPANLQVGIGLNALLWFKPKHIEIEKERQTGRQTMWHQEIGRACYLSDCLCCSLSSLSHYRFQTSTEHTCIGLLRITTGFKPCNWLGDWVGL